MDNKENVTSRIIAYIRKNIQNGTWKTGDKLPSENELCGILKTSRTSVRSALQEFISLGIIESRHGKGSFIISDDLSVFGNEKPEILQEEYDIALWDMKMLLDFRDLMEPEISRRVAEKATSELVVRLEKLLDDMKASVGNSHAFVKADMDFHMAICEAYQNPIAVWVMQTLAQRKIQSYHKLNTVVGYYGGIYYHSLLIDAIKKHDAKRAYSIMDEHLQRGISDLDIDTWPEETDANLRDNESMERGE